MVGFCFERGDGTVIYDSSTDGLPSYWLSLTILPHEIRYIVLDLYIQPEQPFAHYTAEVSWHGKGSPLIGWTATRTTALMDSGDIEITSLSNQMVNMKQK